MITRATLTRIAIAALISGLAAGCGTAAAKSPPAPPASTSQAPPPSAPAPATPPATPSDTPFGLAIGTPVQMTDEDNGAAWDVTLNSISRFAPGQYDDPAPSGSHYIRIDVTYSATAGPVDVNEWDWSAKDSTGLASQVQFISGGNNDLSATTIQTGSKIRGTVVLAITDGSDGTVVYSAGGAEQASWNFTAAQVS